MAEEVKNTTENQGEELAGTAVWIVGITCGIFTALGSYALGLPVQSMAIYGVIAAILGGGGVYIAETLGEIALKKEKKN